MNGSGWIFEGRKRGMNEEIKKIVILIKKIVISGCC